MNLFKDTCGNRKRKATKESKKPTAMQKQTDIDAFHKANKEVQKNVRRDKRNFISKLATEAEVAVRHNDIKALYDSIRRLTIKLQKLVDLLKKRERLQYL